MDIAARRQPDARGAGAGVQDAAGAAAPGLIETASILTTTNLIAETDMIGVVPLSIADTYARHGLLCVLPCPIRHKMESFGSITRRDRPLSEATRFFLAALHRREQPAGV